MPNIAKTFHSLDNSNGSILTTVICRELRMTIKDWDVCLQGMDNVRKTLKEEYKRECGKPSHKGSEVQPVYWFQR